MISCGQIENPVDLTRGILCQPMCLGVGVVLGMRGGAAELFICQKAAAALAAASWHPR